MKLKYTIPALAALSFAFVSCDDKKDSHAGHDHAGHQERSAGDPEADRDSDPDAVPDTHTDSDSDADSDSDTDSDTDADADSDTDADADTDTDSDADTDTDPGEKNCGCSSSTGWTGVLPLALLGALARRRR